MEETTHTGADEQYAEQVDKPEDSRYFQVFEGDVPDEELKTAPPSPMPTELHGLEAHRLIPGVREEDVQS